MKKLKQKKGFTLVECVVAMAVLAIMSLLLTMILNVSLRTRNSNMTLEKELDEQVQGIVKGEDNKYSENNNKIEFFDKDGNSIAEIPGNDEKGVKSDKVYQEGEKAEIGKIEYDFKDYEDYEKLESGKDPEEDKDPVGKKLAYGSAAVEGNINILDPNYGSPVISHTEKDEKGNDVIIYSVTWNVSFDTKSGAPENAVKLTLPKGTTDLKYDKASLLNARVIVIADDLIRIQPVNQMDGKNEEKYTKEDKLTTKVGVNFKISKDDYEKYYKSPEYYFHGGDGSSASITLK